MPDEQQTNIAPDNTVWEDIKRKLEEMGKSAQQYISPLHSHPGVCPNCGYCPHCGRGGRDIYRWEKWTSPYWPDYPTVTW